MDDLYSPDIFHTGMDEGVSTNFQHCYYSLYNNQINAHALIGQSAMVYCASKLMEKLHIFRIIIKQQ